MGAAGRLKKKIQKQQIPSENQNEQGPPNPEKGGPAKLAAMASDPNKREQVSDAQVRQIDDTIGMFMMLIHSEDTRDSVMETLKSNPDPAKAIPATANMLMARVEGQAGKRRTKMGDDVKLAAAQYMMHDLAELGNRAGVWEKQVTEEDMPKILQTTMQMYIRQGFKKGTIDPVQLQLDIEELMSDEQKNLGKSLGQKAGIPLPDGPTANMALEQRSQKGIQKEQAKTEQAKAQAQALKGNIRGAAASKSESEQSEQSAALAGRPPA